MFWIIFIEVWMWAGFSMFLFISGLNAISGEYYESAQLDGASPWQQFCHITLPLLAPSFTVVRYLISYTPLPAEDQGSTLRF